MTVNFYLSFFKSRIKEHRIFLYIRSKKSTCKINIEETIDPKHWNKSMQCAKKSYEYFEELNTKLNYIREEIKKIQREVYQQNGASDFNQVTKLVEELLKSKVPGEKKIGFYESFDQFIVMKKTEVSPKTIQKYEITVDHIRNFEKEINYAITFNSINLVFYDKFKAYLVNTKKHTNNTVGKHLKVIKAFLNWASERKLNTNQEFRKFKAQDKKADIIYLTKTELGLFANKELTDDSHKNVRDIFLFSCYTGQRFTDVMNIKKEDIQIDRWHLHVQKTRDLIVIPLSHEAQRIASKYLDTEGCFPQYTNQFMNRTVKKIGEIAEINTPTTLYQYKGAERVEKILPKYEFISMHTARRTFVTLSLEGGMREEVVRKITGHTDTKVLDSYVKIVDNVKQTELEKVWNN